MTRAPSRASPVAMANPMPLVEPETRAVLSVSFKSIFQYIRSVWRAKQHGISVLSKLRIWCERDERSATSNKKNSKQNKSMESKRYTEGLTSENAALLLIDHQVGLFTGVRDIPVAELKHNVVALAKAAKVLGLPMVVTATSPEMWGPIIPELTEASPGISIINRTTVNAFDEPRFAKAVEATERKKLIIAGVSTEVCLALPAIHATGMGYDAYGVIDASGTFSETKRITGLLRMAQAGVIVTDYSTVAVEMLKDNASPKASALYCSPRYAFCGFGRTIGGSVRQGP